MRTFSAVDHDPVRTWCKNSWMFWADRERQNLKTHRDYEECVKNTLQASEKDLSRIRQAWVNSISDLERTRREEEATPKIHIVIQKEFLPKEMFFSLSIPSTLRLFLTRSKPWSESI